MPHGKTLAEGPALQISNQGETSFILRAATNDIPIQLDRQSHVIEGPINKQLQPNR